MSNEYKLFNTKLATGKVDNDNPCRQIVPSMQGIKIEIDSSLQFVQHLISIRFRQTVIWHLFKPFSPEIY